MVSRIEHATDPDLLAEHVRMCAAELLAIPSSSAQWRSARQRLEAVLHELVAAIDEGEPLLPAVFIASSRLDPSRDGDVSSRRASRLPGDGKRTAPHRRDHLALCG